MEKIFKDWTGNKISSYAQIGASSHSDKERERNDFYATDPSAVLLLGQHHSIPAHIWEPSCGMGHLSKALLSKGHDVFSTDLIDRGYGQGNVDFFQQEEALGAADSEDYCILTNPPYRFANEYVVHALHLLKEGQQLILFLKTVFLETSSRFDAIFKNTPPRYVYQHVRRVSCAPNGDFSHCPTSAVAYAWFVWIKGDYSTTEVRWLNEGKEEVRQLNLFG